MNLVQRRPRNHRRRGTGRVLQAMGIQTVEPSDLMAQILERMGNLEKKFLELRKLVQELD